MEQIAISMNQLDSVTQRNAKNALELSSAAEELDGQSSGLSQLMEFFKIDDNSHTILSPEDKNSDNIEMDLREFSRM